MADAEKSLLFVIKANVEDFNRQLGKAERDFKKSFGNIKAAVYSTANTFMGLGAAMGGAVAGATVSFARTADAIQDLSTKTGIGVEELQRLKYAARVSGTDLNGLETAVKKMQQAVYAGSEAFAELGLNLDQLKLMDTSKQFDAVMKALAGIPNAGTRAALAVKIFGKSGTDMLPMLDSGAQGFERLKQRADELGIVFTEKTIKAASQLNDELDTLKIVFEAAVARIAQTDAFKNLVDWLIKVIGRIGEWIDKSPVLIRVLAEAGAAILAVGLALKGAAIAMAILQALSGPKGWIQLAVGAAAAAGAITLIEMELGKVNSQKGGIDALNGSVESLVGNIDEASSKVDKLNKKSVIVFGGGNTRGHGVTGAWAEGGVFTRPTFGLIGEAGPEAVIPLDRLSGMGAGNRVTNINLSVGNYMGDEMSRRALVRDLQRIINEEDRRSVHRPSLTEFYSVGGHL